LTLPFIQIYPVQGHVIGNYHVRITIAIKISRWNSVRRGPFRPQLIGDCETPLAIVEEHFVGLWPVASIGDECVHVSIQVDI
jgi:hypothetical protein